ncbi:MAG TPA: hypothetical protein VMH00_03725 [Candidatus Limnocylindrales bacterium]|nr:hypothetical protein [Candidatus Limnocylindrales bacterium]
MAVDAVPQPARQNVEEIQSADLVVGILAELDQPSIAGVCDSLRALPGTPRAMVLYHRAAPHSEPATAEQPATPEGDSVSLIPLQLQDPGAPGPIASIVAAYESVFRTADRLGARGCCVIASRLERADPQWVQRLSGPLLDGSLDFIAPCYTRHKFEGLLNNSIVYPLSRSLYGRRIQNPMGPDLGISQRFLQRLLANQEGKPAGGLHLLASVAPLACCENFQVAQLYLGSRTYPPVDWTSVSSLLAEILGPVFLTVERNAACWQKTRNSMQVKALNNPPPPEQTAATVELDRLLSSFQQGTRDLQEIWGLVLPPASLLEIRKISRLAPEQFLFPDSLWSRIVYDFALAHRLRTINRDHLLRSLTPLYLGWIASYSREFETSGTVAVEKQLERLSLAYEAEKPYLVSRWRWPDRFNP